MSSYTGPITNHVTTPYTASPVAWSFASQLFYKGESLDFIRLMGAITAAANIQLGIAFSPNPLEADTVGITEFAALRQLIKSDVYADGVPVLNPYVPSSPTGVFTCDVPLNLEFSQAGSIVVAMGFLAAFTNRGLGVIFSASRRMMP